ncbi:MAG: hypothetical protein RBS73_09115 [Prolixibacteraceae bacterium]|jgi:hypothetical protein|nr:hypothetical protein [Prolixibacteraceae bacterium]
MTVNYASGYLENLLKGNRAGCSAIAKEYLTKNPSVKDLYEEVFRVALYEVGKGSVFTFWFPKIKN